MLSVFLSTFVYKQKKNECEWQPTFTPELNIVTAVVVLTKAFVSGCPSKMLQMWFERSDQSIILINYCIDQ